MTQEYIENNKSKFLDELMELLTIPSVSADLSFKDDVLKAATFLCDQLTQIGTDNVQLFPTAGHPIVYGEKIISFNAPTVLVYGHYDVQPADPYELWDSEPFKPEIRKTKTHPDGAIFARGACDDKGQMFMHLKAFEAMYKTNNLNCNVKFMLEGEEEVGSENLEKFVREHKDMLKADVVLVSDTGIINNQTPSICVGLRGLSYLEVEVTGPNRDLHSGLYGGGVANPINILSSMIASLHDESGKINIPEFYKNVIVVSDEERQEMSKAPFNLDDYKKWLLEKPKEKAKPDNNQDNTEFTRPQKVNRKEQRQAAAELRKATQKMRKKAASLEVELSELVEKRQMIITELGDQKTYTVKKNELESLFVQKDVLDKKIQQCEQDWLELEEEIEKSSLSLGIN